jgi:hypothetical protein
MSRATSSWLKIDGSSFRIESLGDTPGLFESLGVEEPRRCETVLDGTRRQLLFLKLLFNSGTGGCPGDFLGLNEFSAFFGSHPKGELRTLVADL